MSKFQFKQFEINQEGAPFKVGTDSMILGAWARVENDDTVLDIGTGTGILAIMVAQRIENGHVLALEPEREAFLLAEENAVNSKFSKRLVVINDPLQKIVTSSKFDMIITNPPYFIDSTKKADPSANRARHTDTLTFSEIIEFSFMHLSEAGRLNVVLPANEADVFEKAALQRGFFKSRELLISSFEGTAVKRRCTEYVMYSTETEINELYIRKREDNQYSDDYVKLTGEYHFKL